MSNSAIRVINLQGEDGAVYKSSAGALTIPTGRNVKVIQAHAASVVSVVSSNITGDAITAVSLPAGMAWAAQCSAVTLTSGEITAYLTQKA